MSLLVAKIAALGAMAGALAGAVAAAGWLVIFAPRDLGALALGALIAAPIGAVFGAVLFPLAGFTMLRQVPLWRIIALTLAGTSIGGIIGAQYLGSAWLLGPVTGFCAAVTWLALRARGKRLFRSVALYLIALFIPAVRLRAQSAHDESGVRAAVRQVFAAHQMPEDSTREAPDSAAVWQRFVRCAMRNDGRNVCALTEGKEVYQIGVHLITPDSATVSIDTYYMVDHTCGGYLPDDPHHGVIDPPIISHGLRLGDMTFVYRNGNWVIVGRPMVVTC
jgi:hypothetical protein